jgi:hypothetical protein
VKITAKRRDYLAIQHLRSAAFFARMTHEIERSSKSLPSGDGLVRYWAGFTGAIFASVGFLEGLINELFADAAVGGGSRLKGLRPEAIKLMASLWEQDVPRTARYSVLKKYQIALVANDCNPLDKGSKPYQDANSLVILRNALVHYEPEWSDSGAMAAHSRQSKQLCKRLKKRFLPNPFVPEHTPFFPTRCLSHGCTEWAVKTALAFADAFFEPLELEQFYRNEPEFLETKVINGST